MKSDKRLDEQIKAVADLWNYTSPAKGVNDPANLIASAVYDTLRWARGCREKDQVNYATRLAADALNCSPVSFCIRDPGHEGPCNGMPRRQCPGYQKGE